MICDQNHQSQQKSTTRISRKLFWPEKGFSPGFYWRFLVGGGGGAVDNDDEKNPKHK